MLAVLCRFLEGLSRVHALYRLVGALNESHIVVSSRPGVPAGSYRRVRAFAAGWKLALFYCGAAQRDEKDGFPLTAAMEWRHAADLFRFVPIARQCCWCEWERIMHLPRRLASPILDTGVMVLHDTSGAPAPSKIPTAALEDADSARQREVEQEGAAMTLSVSWRNPVPPRKIKTFVRKIVNKKGSAVYTVFRSRTDEELELLDRTARRKNVSQPIPIGDLRR